MRFCIIHSHCVEHAFNDESYDIKYRKMAGHALREINRIRDTIRDVVCIEYDHPAKAVDYFSSGDVVILCGAYRDACLTTAKSALMKKGIEVKFHAIASIPAYPVCEVQDNLPQEMLYTESTATDV